MRSYPYYRDALADEALPLAWCDLELFDRNVAALARRAGGTCIRIASKSLRCVTLIQRALEHEGYRGVMAFTCREAEHLATQGIDDLLVAYPTMEKADLAAAARVAKSGTAITLMVDDPAQVSAASTAALDEGVVLALCIDIDLSMALPGLHFGVRRSPLRTPEQVLALANIIARQEGVRLHGVMGYEAQIAGVPDKSGNAAKDLALRLLKRRSVDELRARRATLCAALRDAGHELGLVNGGGTGSLESTAAEDVVTEIGAGSGLFGPTLFDGYRNFQHEPALGFALSVVRRPAADIVTCLGGGYIASGSVGPERQPSPYLPSGLSLLPLEGAGEVQTPLRGDAARELALGMPVLFRHAKAGELCERFAELVLIEGGEVAGRAPTYRGQGVTFC